MIEKYRKWLIPSDPSTNQKNAIEKHHPDTGLWLLEHSKYKDWKQKSNSFMWIHGICEKCQCDSYVSIDIVAAGAGKTILL